MSRGGQGTRGGRGRRSRERALALALAFAASSTAWSVAGAAGAAPHVTGRVNTIQRPLGGAQVIVLETGAMARTDSLGRFDLGAFGPGVYSLRVVAVGYAPAAGTVSVDPDGASVPSTWLLKPLHPDGQGLTHGLTVPRGLVAADQVAPDTGLGRPGTAQPGGPVAPPPTPAPPAPPVPEPALAAPIAPILGLWLSDEELAARPALPGPLGELLPQMAFSDSLTAVSGGTNEPGAETWRQWSERIGAWAAANPGHARAPLARRAVAYARTRLALADGHTWAGYQAARTAREAVAAARPDTTGGVPAAAFLDSLAVRLDTAFVPGTSPPKPVPAPRHHGKHRRTRHKRAR